MQSNQCTGEGLFAEGSDAAKIKVVQTMVEKDGGTTFLVAPRVGGAKVSGGATLKADGQLAGSPSQLFDAIAVVLSEKGCEMLMNEGAAVQFVMDAFGHLKAIGASAEAKPLLNKAGVKADGGVTDLGKDFIMAGRRRFWDREPTLRLLA